MDGGAVGHLSTVEELATVWPAGAARLDLRSRAEPAQLRMIRRRVDAWAEVNALSEAALIDLQLALGEAVSNGVEHAYLDGGAGTVDVALEIRPAASTISNAGAVVSVRVCDHGRWRPVPATPGYRGRGLALIERLSDDMQVSGTPHGTKICFEIPLRR